MTTNNMTKDQTAAENIRTLLSSVVRAFHTISPRTRATVREAMHLTNMIDEVTFAADDFANELRRRKASTIVFRENAELQALYDVESFTVGASAPMFADLMVSGDERCNTAVAIVSEAGRDSSAQGLVTIVESQDAQGKTCDGDDPHEWERLMPAAWQRDRIVAWATQHLSPTTGTDELEALGFVRVN